MLFVSTRRDGRSLGELVKEEMGATAGDYCAGGDLYDHGDHPYPVLAMIVVKALTHSPWNLHRRVHHSAGHFMGILFATCVRDALVVSVIGLVLLVFAIISGGWVAETGGTTFFDFTGVQLTRMLVGTGFVAAVLPVWLLLAPRDYLSTFLKIGTIVGLAIGILIMRLTLTMPALTKFVDGTWPGLDR